MLIEVTRDLFDIATRLREIDERYHLFWSNRAMRYEVHSSNRPSVLTHQFTVPYDALDCRTLEYAQRTRIGNQCEREIDAHNRSVEASAERSVQQAVARLEDMLTFASRTSHEVNFDDKRRIWI